MPRKKTKYEKKGFVRQIAGSIFSSNDKSVPDEGWRPRKNQFERLEGDGEEDFDHFSIHQAFSLAESETGEYKRIIFFETKKEALGNVNRPKRDLSSIALKPSAKDSAKVRKTNKPRHSHRNHGVFENDPFGASIGFEKCDESVDDSTSKYTNSSRQSASTKQSTFLTVKSDPSEFFSKQPIRLSKKNLDAMASSAVGRTDFPTFGDGIENKNPRNMFHQFTIDEDKESTVILPVGSSGDDSFVDYDCGDDETEQGQSVTSKGTKIQVRALPRGATSRRLQASVQDMFIAGSGSERTGDSNRIMPNQGKESTLKKGFHEDMVEFPSTSGESSFFAGSEKKRHQIVTRGLSNHSLSYSETSPSNSWRVQSPSLFLSGGAGRRQPLSPFNPETPPNSTGKVEDSCCHKNSEKNPTWAPFSLEPTSRMYGGNENIDPSFSKTEKFHEKSMTQPKNGMMREAFEQSLVDSDSQSTLEHDTENGPVERSVVGANEISSWSKRVRNRAWGPSPVPENEVLSVSIVTADTERGFPAPPNSWRLERTAGISNFGGSSSPLSKSSHGSFHSGHNRFGQGDRSLCSHGRPKALCCHVDESREREVEEQQATSAYGKPMGLPNNAIMASMLFRTHHTMDTTAVDAKLREREVEKTKLASTIGDVPQSILAHEDAISMVSSFSHDTALVEAWRKPTKDLLAHFSSSRPASFVGRNYAATQRAQSSALFEA